MDTKQFDIKLDALVAHDTLDYKLIPMYEPNIIESVKLLPTELREISGLSYEDGSIWAVNDEEGHCFLINPLSGNVDQIQQFAGPGDYEGIEILNNQIFVITSNGFLFCQPLSKKKNRTFNLHFHSYNNIEGLGKIHAEEKLLIALKGRSAFEKGDSKGKEIYSLTFKNKRPRLSFLWSISKKELKSWVKKNYKNKKEKAYLKRVERFAPSGIAGHTCFPLVYILSSEGKTLIVCDYKGNILHIYFLDNHLHLQPEGITFDENCNLYIADEGVDKRAKLYRFSPSQKNNLN